MFFQKREACDSDTRDRLTKTKQIAQRKVSKIKKVHRNVLRKRGECDSDTRDRLTKDIVSNVVKEIWPSAAHRGQSPALRTARESGRVHSTRPFRARRKTRPCLTLYPPCANKPCCVIGKSKRLRCILIRCARISRFVWSANQSVWDIFCGTFWEIEGLVTVTSGTDVNRN